VPNPTADLVFSACAGVGSLAIAVLAAAKATYWVAGVWALVAFGFSLRAAYDWRRTRR
jgi:hypothetical protein